MTQTVLPFKLDVTDDCITSQAGLVLFGELMAALGMAKRINQALPGPKRAVGYAPAQMVMPLLLMLHGGGRTLEDLRQLRCDEGLRELLKWEAMPSPDAVGDWLRRMGAGEGLAGLAAVNRGLLPIGLKGQSGPHTLDIDASQIIAEKASAQYTYQGEKGYMPMVGHLENGWVIGDEFREGNVAPASDNLGFSKPASSNCPPAIASAFCEGTALLTLRA